MESRVSPLSTCPHCIIYKLRIQELERINQLHRKENGELREALNDAIKS